MGDNFIFKLNIFYNKCQLITVPSNAYLEDVSVIFTEYAQTHFYANRESNLLFNDFC